MRIRTIKPEFWTDSLMVSLPRDARLLFIGLWNVADDHGWIPDDPNQVRFLLFPGDADIDVSALIELLVATGRLEHHQTESGRRLLKVAHWTDHQRVDRPTPSKLVREPSRKIAIPLSARRAIATKYGCQPGERKSASCYFCGAPGEIRWFRLANGSPSSWVVFPGLEIDHFVPESSGGENVAGNLVLSCRECNRSRGSKDAMDFLMAEVASPREPSRALAPDQGSGIRDQGARNRDQGSMGAVAPTMPIDGGLPGITQKPSGEPSRRPDTAAGEKTQRIPQSERRPAGGFGEVVAYFKARGGSPAEAEKFFDYYEGNGWVQGRTPLKKWQAAANRWIRTADERTHHAPNGHRPASRRDVGFVRPPANTPAIPTDADGDVDPMEFPGPR